MRYMIEASQCCTGLFVAGMLGWTGTVRSSTIRDRATRARGSILQRSGIQANAVMSRATPCGIYRITHM